MPVSHRIGPRGGLRTMFLLAAGSAMAAGHFGLAARVPEPRLTNRAPLYFESEPNDSPATATPIPAGGQRQVIGLASIAWRGDEDYWTFVSCANCDVTILVDTGGTAYGDSTDSVVELYASDGATLIEANDDGGLGTGGDLTKETDASSLIAGRRLGAGRYFIRVRSSNPQRLIVPYRLVVLLAASYAPEVEFNGTPGTAQALPFDRGIVGLLASAADLDYYEKLGANSATSLCVVVNGDHLQTGTSTNLVLSIRDVNDNLLLTVNSAFDPGGRKGQAACFPTTLPTYRFRVESNQGSTGFYSIFLTPGRTASPSRIDFDRDFRSEIAVWRPSSGNWHILPAKHEWDPAAELRIQWGAQGDVPAAADYDGDGVTDAAVFRPATGAWYIRRSTNPGAPLALVWGQNGDLPRPRDFDGDGLADPAVWRPSTGQWFVLKSSTNYATTMSVAWGMNGDVPIPGEHDGDGRADFAVWRPSTGAWLRLASSRGHAPVPAVQFGQTGDVPVMLSSWFHFNREVVFRPSNGFWYGISLQWGMAGDVPFSGDYSGLGSENIGVWRPSTGVWFVTSQSPRTWGMAGDVPIADMY